MLDDATLIESDITGMELVVSTLKTGDDYDAAIAVTLFSREDLGGIFRGTASIPYMYHKYDDLEET